ncbi:MAG: hypothetical protein M3Q23_05040 [Actinomycetota bacterium]|nr:hypothetical protein [Actinomycetota bacterium]
MRRLLAATAVAVTLALGLWVAVGASASASRTRPGAPARQAPASRVLSANHSVSDASSGTTAVVSLHSGHPGPVGSTDETGDQSGDQSESTSESESGSESGGGTETDTHQDPAGQDVNHECPPSCDTANGEKP